MNWVRGHVEVSRIKARARTEVELGRDVLADLLVLQRGHRRPSRAGSSAARPFIQDGRLGTMSLWRDVAWS